MTDLAEKEKKAIERLKAFEPESEPYYLCYSGGKDSDVILILAQLAGVKFEAVHNLTTVDAPETVRYVKSKGIVKIDHPEKTMWQLIVEKGMPPTRVQRYCCETQKEKRVFGRLKVTGVRWDESVNRKKHRGIVDFQTSVKTVLKAADETGADVRVNEKKGAVLNLDNDEGRRLVEMCYRTSQVLVNPIIDWTDEDVWGYLYYYRCPSNPLYGAVERNGTYTCTGCKRVGCLVCPMQGSKGMKDDLRRYPKYRDQYLRAFDKCIKERNRKGLETRPAWQTPRAMMMWWVGDDPMQQRFMEPDYLEGACL